MQNNLTGSLPEGGVEESPNECLVSTHPPYPPLQTAFNVNLFAIWTQTLATVFWEHKCTQVGRMAAQINSAVFGVFTKAYTSPVSTFTNWQTLSRHSQLMQAETLIVLILRQDMFSSSTSWKYVFSRHSIGLITDREGSKTVACARDYT